MPAAEAGLAVTGRDVTLPVRSTAIPAAEAGLAVTGRDVTLPVRSTAMPAAEAGLAETGRDVTLPVRFTAIPAAEAGLAVMGRDVTLPVRSGPAAGGRTAPQTTDPAPSPSGSCWDGSTSRCFHRALTAVCFACEKSQGW